MGGGPRAGVYRRYQGTSPQPPGATELLADTLFGVRVRNSILGHSTVSQPSLTKPPVSPELAFQHLRSPERCASNIAFISLCAVCTLQVIYPSTWQVTTFWYLAALR